MRNIIYKLNYKELDLKGFYMDLIHKEIPEPYISITEELHEELLKKEYKFKECALLIEKDIYTIEDIYIFEEVIRKANPYQHSQVEQDVSFLSNILSIILEPMMLPSSDNENEDKRKLLLKLNEITDRYSHVGRCMSEIRIINEKLIDLEKDLD